MIRKILHLLFFICIGFFQSLSAQHISGSNADSLYNIGNQLTSKAGYEEASFYFKKAMSLYLQEGDSVKWIEASLDYGETLVDRGFVREGLDFFLQIENNTPSDLPLSVEARIQNNLGWAYRRLQDNEEAQSYYLSGLDLAKEARDTLMIARINNNLSYIESDRGNYQKALDLRKENARFYRELDDRYRLSIVLSNIFSTLADLGLYKISEDYLRESLAIREELENPDLLDLAYHNMAWLFNRQGKTDSAIVYYQRSLELSRMLENPYDITQTLLNIGGLYEESGDNTTALQYYEEALSFNEQTERPVSISENLRTIGDVYANQGKISAAKSYYSRAESLLTNTEAPAPLADLYLNQASMYLMDDTPEEALRLSHQALALSLEKKLLNQQIYAYGLQGSIFSHTGDPQKSLEAYRKAYHLIKTFPAASRVPGMMNLSRAYRASGSDSAFILARQSFSVIDSLQQNITGLTFKAGLFSNYAGFYNEVASWHLAEGNSDAAFELVEAAKARVLLDELAEAREQVFARLDETTLIKRQQKIKNLDRLHNQVETATDPEEKTNLKRKLADAEFEYQTFINEVRLSNENWKNFTYPEPVTATKAKNFPDRNTGIIEFAFSGSSLIQIHLFRNQITGSVVDSVAGVSALDYIAGLESQFREGIAQRIATGELAAITHKLYELLLEEVLTGHPEVKNLVIVQDGPLSFLPFEAFDTGEQYLIQTHNVKYLPSISIYDFIQNPHRPAQQDLLALAGTGFQSGSLTQQTRSQDSFASLPATILEVDSIAAHFNQTKVLKNEDVTEAGLKSFNLGDFRFLHFATHGDIDENNPSQSGLILSKNTEVESLFGEDGYLNSMEISTLNLNSDMVVLSACNTGIGKQISGEGLLGLQRSFLTAGASAVSVSLWNVFDRSTALFMDDFYESMLRHKEEDYGLINRSLDYFGWYTHPLFDYKAKALREAKLKMIDHPYYNHPAYWAPFILIGK